MANNRRWWGMIGLVALLAGGSVLMVRPWQSGAQPKPRRSDFAADRLAANRFAFDPDRAMTYLKRICDLGPRISGSEGMKRQQEMLKKHFEACGATVELQRFEARQRSRKQPVAMANLIARWRTEAPRRVLICAHYDTRPLADEEPNPRDWTRPFLGANDGASGPAFLMEMAHHVEQLGLQIGLDFVLFDGEEYIFDNRPEEQGGDRYFLGSAHFAVEYVRRGRRPTYVAAVLVDMIAGKNARFPYEGYSYSRAAGLCRVLWGIAADLGETRFVPQVGTAVRDDHLPLLNLARIPAIDIIDFSYPHWHRLSDRPENCSGEPMASVGRVLAVWLRRLR